MMASPLLACSSPAMIFSRVDLPVPLGPTTPILAPCRKDRVTLSRTTLSPWALRTLRSVKTYSAMIRKPKGQHAHLPIRVGGRCDRIARSVELGSVGLVGVQHLPHAVVLTRVPGGRLRGLGEGAGALGQVVPHERR